MDDAPGMDLRSVLLATLLALPGLMAPPEAQASASVESSGPRLMAPNLAPAVRRAVIAPATTSSLQSAESTPASSAAADAEVPQASADEPETITERNADGTPRLERAVIRDVDNNYVNHGRYVLYGPGETIVRAGEFDRGRQQGPWMQVVSPADLNVYAGPLRGQFSGPFLSVATFAAGKLDGFWTVEGRDQQKVVQWQFRAGQPDGVWTWWYPSGQILREVTFVDGQPTGQWREWDAKNVMSVRAEFVGGRPIVRKVQWYRPGQKQYEGQYHMAGTMSAPVFDWWTNRAQLAAPEGSTLLKHGSWTSWYPNGQMQTEGEFVDDVPNGHFTWWHENGQKQAEGNYNAGAQTGRWVSWHANGQRETECTYRGPLMTGKFYRWTAEGQLAEFYDFDKESTAAEPATLPPDVLQAGRIPQAPMPVPRH